MNAVPPGAAELEAVIDALDEVIDLTAQGHAAFVESRDRQLALTFLWVNIGSLLKQYCRRLNIPVGADTFSGPIKMRDKIAYGPVTALSPDVIWDTCVQDALRLRDLLSDLRKAL